MSGGLGNQLFQYAFARSLALRSGAALELDTRTLFRVDRRYRRGYELSAFCLAGETRFIKGTGMPERLRRRLVMSLQRNRRFDARTYVDEPRPLRYHPEYSTWVLDRNVTLTGYWQCLEYFRETSEALRSDLRFREPLPEADRGLAGRLESGPSVAVHVRRVDYGTTLGLDYYTEAIRRMRERVPGARFYVFSDDPCWWREHGDNSPDITIASSASTSATGDFRLMTHCRHFIIANSSYSWWAAWLGGCDAKHVIAPGSKYWLNKDTVPVEWEAIG